MKGLELPVNALVVIVIAVVVLVGIILLFSGTFTGSKSSFQLDIVKNTACKKLVETGCGDPVQINKLEIDADKNGKSGEINDNLQNLCENYYNVATGKKDDCRKLCGCST